jgi:NAD(P)-dependent dehydrogenase (short-subunit alcohol dehydrogenase family)
MSHRRVVVVTGGGGGIGAAIATELHRQGAYVVTVDPLVSLDGSEKIGPTQPAVGDRAVDLSVTDADGVRVLFAQLVDEFGRLDAVVNVAGISRPTSFTRGSEDDWRAVLDVHLNGYRTILAAALPLMATAGYGRVLGVTSGSGWRAADTGAYGCAKRAVASLTWELGRNAPPGVVINAISPIAVTRMVTAALGKAPAAGPSAKTGGLNLGSMPEPEAIGPLAAHLVGDGFDWCTGEVVFAGGSEAAVVERPRLLEVVRADTLPSAFGALMAAEANQSSGGGSNPRFTSRGDDAAGVAVETCAVVSDRPHVAEAVAAALKARGVTSTPIASANQVREYDAVVVALAGESPSGERAAWERILREHDTVVDGVFEAAMWARAVADAARPMRLVTLTDARSAGGRSRAQSAAQHARSARKATEGRVVAFAVSDEGGSPTDAAALVSRLLCQSEAEAVAGAELVAGPGWFGVRSHPRPSASFVLGDASVPEWFDDALREVVR